MPAAEDQPPPLPLDPNAPRDFDFIIGHWRVHHARLKQRLANSTEWVEFEGESSTRKTLGGWGNLEDNLLRFPEGPVRAVALRSYDTATRQWSIWWLDARRPGQLDTPVRGAFEGGVGLFFADDVLDGAPIRVRFTRFVDAVTPRWEQAFSKDEGRTWETNWRMRFVRLDG